VAICTLITLILTIGYFGQELTQELTLPFFSALKNVTLFRSIGRLESVFITLWTITDFVLITSFVYIIVNILKHISKIKKTEHIAAPVMLAVFLLAMVIAKTSFELETFTTNIALWGDFILAVPVPLVILAIGKIRHKV